MKYKQQNHKHRFWMNLAFGYIVALFISVVVLFFNLSSIYISVSCFTICFITVIGAKICFARADQYEFIKEAPLTDNGYVNEEKTTKIETMVSSKGVDVEVNVDPTKTKTQELKIVEDVKSHVTTNDILVEESPVLTEGTSTDTCENHEESNALVESNCDVMKTTEGIETKGNELEPFEQEIIEQIQSILANHNRDVTVISTKNVGTYFDVLANSTMLRFKLKGRKQYVLTQLDESVLKEKGLTSEMPSKSERFNSRLILTSSDVLKEISDYIVENYDKVS